MDIILYTLPISLVMVMLPKFLLVLLAKWADNALFKEKIIDKEIRNKLYRNGIFADLIAILGMSIFNLICSIIESPNYFTDLEDYFEYFSLILFSFAAAPDYSNTLSILCVLVTIIISALISLFFDYFTIFRNPDLTKKQKIVTLIIFILLTAPYYFLISLSAIF